jgi:superfamily II DNA or RNA helicase
VPEVSLNTFLAVLPKARLVQLGQQLGVSVPEGATQEAQVERLAESKQLRWRALFEWMKRDELRRACERLGLPSGERARPVLMGRLLEYVGAPDSATPRGIFGGRLLDPLTPAVGAIVQVRRRQYLVEGVTPPGEPYEATRVDLVCLDDDAEGQRLSVLWELELGARVQKPETEGLGAVERLDPPRYFAAYLSALKWHQVTATDAALFQSPFRAGIKLFDHQLIPLKKALELPRANLFIADDVGLGKTIEAGLVLSELELRQRVSFVLIVCPAAIVLQWKREMEVRFGQRFEVFDRAFVAERRRERGFGVPAWTTHHRFIISYQTLRRPEYYEPLRAHLGDRLTKSLLVLDEAHTAAPASSSKYAIDSRITHVVRDLAPRFENRLFLSATPHNGHSNSFSALMELLDPQRFTRGVPIEKASKSLEQVMVRRLKRDLREAGLGTFPRRRVVRLELTTEPASEVTLSRLLTEYTALMKPKKGRGQLVFINLQKRLLSSVEAFARTLEAHAGRVASGAVVKDAQLELGEAPGATEPAEARDAEEDELDREIDAEAAQSTTALDFTRSDAARARDVLAEMQRLAQSQRSKADAKTLAIIAWIKEHLCSGERGAKWAERRLIVFTEYADTKRALMRALDQVFEETHLGEERVRGFHGAMDDREREELQRHFNGDPQEFPVRVLVATDAAREGLNLQNYCADLFHYDIPWNPARMEQRNGRIDRTLQPSEEVRCHYFAYKARAEDRVLDKLVEKVELIQQELGSLGDVVMQRWERALAAGIDTGTEQTLAAEEPAPAIRQAAADELESQRATLATLREQTDQAAAILNRSRKTIEFSPERLRDVVDVGLELAAGRTLEAVEVADIRGQAVFRLPELPESWQRTLDALRPARERDEDFFEWRRRPPQPVVFRPLDRIGDERVHLHLEHPLVQRVLSRFVAQGFGAHDLTRVTVVPSTEDAIARVIVFGRLSLFGAGAARLHDRLVSVAAQWLESKGVGHLRPFADDADRRALERLDALLERSRELPEVPAPIRQRLAASAAADFAALWPSVTDEADARAHEAEQQLTERGATEARALAGILDRQRELIRKTLGDRRQLGLFEGASPDEQKQWESERDHLEQRLTRIDAELEREPRDIEALYRVSLKRLAPVGLVYLWPATRM